MGRLTDRARAKVAGPAWDALRDALLRVNDALLNVSADTCADLTTVYVKYTTTESPTAPAYAVVWLKTSKQFVVGLALPEDLQHPALCAAPAGMMYKGLTKYLVVKPGDTLPDDIGAWARLAYDTASA